MPHLLQRLPRVELRSVSGHRPVLAGVHDLGPRNLVRAAADLAANPAARAYLVDGEGEVEITDLLERLHEQFGDDPNTKPKQRADRRTRKRSPTVNSLDWTRSPEGVRSQLVPA